MAVNSIRRLFVLAGPRGCGKSTFLEDPSRYLHDSVPSELESLAQLGPRHLTVNDLARRPLVFRKEAWLHVDLITPMTTWPVYDSEGLYQAIRPEIFDGWGALGILKKAKEIHFVDMYASREVTFQRWLRRTVTEPKATVLKNLVNIYGNPDQNDRLYRRVYAAWSEFVGTFPNSRQWMIRADVPPYQFRALETVT